MEHGKVKKKKKDREGNWYKPQKIYDWMTGARIK